MRYSFLSILVLLVLYACRTNVWEPLFTEEGLPEHNHYLGRPDSSLDVPGLKRDSTGIYLEGLGWNDPLDVFSVTELDGEPVIRISGEVVGGLVLADSIGNYHLKLKYKWGDIKWKWMQGRPKDGGILYHQVMGARHEFQIHEGDVGSYWSRRVIVDIPARYTTQIPLPVQKAKPFLSSLVNTLNDTMLIFERDNNFYHFPGNGAVKDWQIVIANPYNEKPSGEWNDLELICWENHAAHLVNGKINMMLFNSFYISDGVAVPLKAGRLSLQSEGAEIFFKDIRVKYLDKMPELFNKYLR